MDDQAKTLMPRTESLSRFDAIDKRAEEVKLLMGGDIQDLRVLIGNLRESRSEGVGSNAALHDYRGQINVSTTQTLQTIGLVIVGAGVMVDILLKVLVK